MNGKYRIRVTLTSGQQIDVVCADFTAKWNSSGECFAWDVVGLSSHRDLYINPSHISAVEVMK